MDPWQFFLWMTQIYRPSSGFQTLFSKSQIMLWFHMSAPHHRAAVWLASWKLKHLSSGNDNFFSGKAFWTSLADSAPLQTLSNSLQTIWFEEIVKHFDMKCKEKNFLTFSYLVWTSAGGWVRGQSRPGQEENLTGSHLIHLQEGILVRWELLQKISQNKWQSHCAMYIVHCTQS